MNTHRRWLMVRASTAAVATAMLAGCAVSPSPLGEADLMKLADTSMTNVASNQEPISDSIGLHEAIARALKYNLDHQVELAEHAVRERELDLAHYSLMPTAVMNAGHTGRDRLIASSSQNVLTGTQSLATSTSQDKRLRSHDAVFGWNILDFGLSYVRARQAADKALIQNELRRKVTLRIIDDTRTAYWRAVSAQRLLGQLRRVEANARSVERDARNLAADKQSSPITALTYEREVVEIQRTIGELARELNAAHAQLGALMNLQPGTRFTVAGGTIGPRALPQGNISELHRIALANRPELREVFYRQRINEHEVHAALLEMLPGLNLYAGANFDSNSFLLENHWQNWGAKAGWNLIKVFSHPARRAMNDEQDDLLAKKALAVTMAVMTQVYVARIRYAHAIKEHHTAQRFYDVQKQLLDQIRVEASADRVSRQTLVREQLNTLVARAKADIAGTQLEAAYAMVLSSMGVEPEVTVTADVSVTDLARALHTSHPGLMRVVHTK